MKNIFICIAFLTATQSMVYAQFNQQTDDSGGYKSAVSIVPQYAIISGIRVDYERQLKNKEKWLLFAPQLYLRTNTGSGGNRYNYDNVTGFGMNVLYKQFLGHSKKKNENGMSRTNVYFSTGPTFQRTNIKVRNQTTTTVINKFGGNVNFGVQFIFGNFLLDLYTGIGIRYAIDADGNLLEDFSDSWIDYGYSGILLDGGVRLGFLIP